MEFIPCVILYKGIKIDKFYKATYKPSLKYMHNKYVKRALYFF